MQIKHILLSTICVSYRAVVRIVHISYPPKMITIRLIIIMAELCSKDFFDWELVSACSG